MMLVMGVMTNFREQARTIEYYSTDLLGHPTITLTTTDIFENAWQINLRLLFLEDTVKSVVKIDGVTTPHVIELIQ